MTSLDLSDDERRELARKRLKELCENPCSEDFIDGSLTEEDQEFVNNHRFADGTKLNNSFDHKGEGYSPVSLENLSNDEWSSKLFEKYYNLRNTVTENFPSLWDSLEFELSIQKILNIKKCTLPFAGIVLGRPSSFKTVGIELFRKWINVFYTDSFSAKAFVSHNTGLKETAKLDVVCFLIPWLDFL